MVSGINVPDLPGSVHVGVLQLQTITFPDMMYTRFLMERFSFPQLDLFISVDMVGMMRMALAGVVFGSALLRGATRRTVSVWQVTILTLVTTTRVLQHTLFAA